MIFGRLSGTWLVPYVCITEAMGIKLSVNNDLFMVIHFVNTTIVKKGITKNGSCHSDLFEGRLVKVSV